jgi:hypothetical protein
MESMSQPESNFNYDLIAELFPTRSDAETLPAVARRGGRRPTGYGRFARAAYAVRFAIEELPADLLFETCLRVDEQIFDGDGIRKLYESDGYPFIRRTPTWSPRSPNILPWKPKRR